MNKLKKDNLTKKIICIIITLMLCNFIIPNYTYAVATESGGKFLEVIAQFVCSIPDAVINYLQTMFASPNEIKLSGEYYKIFYSPGTIFAGQIPAFSINFIDPMDNKEVIKEVTWISVDDIETGIIGKVFNRLKQNKIDSSVFYPSIGGPSQYKWNQVHEDNYYNVRYITGSVSGFDYDEWLKLDVVREFIGSYDMHDFWIANNEIYLYVSRDRSYVVATEMAYALFQTTLSDEELSAFEALRIDSNTKTTEFKSSTQILQPVVATWYNALRRIAIVGLLSVLLYIGIRIVLTSTSAKDKAKYKKMLKDWLVALCILFTLHYVMNITITVVNKINEIIGASAIGPSGEDLLMSEVRNTIARNEAWGAVITFLVIYCVLAVYTVIFTIQYLKRTIYIGFLTMIAPLITLTYPLDKIKDNKSQAFDMWLKDYIFFSLIQVLHLLIYYIFLSSSMNLANKGNWIYAIVAIGFITKAEKLMKKMFGFEKSKSLGAMAAGATGAMVTNVMNKINGGGGSKSSGGNTAGGTAGGSSSVRTATTSPLQGLVGGKSSPSGGESLSSPSAGGNSSTGSRNSNNSSKVTKNPSRSLTGGRNPNNPSARLRNTSDPSTESGNSNNSSSTRGTTKGQASRKNKPKPNVIKGATTILGRYSKGALGILLGGTGAIIGLAAGVSQGDMGKAFAGLTGGAAAGNYLARNSVDIAKQLKKDLPKKAYEIADTYREGAYGQEYADNVKFDREFRRSADYKKLKSNNTNFSDAKIQQMLDEGISDAKQMDKILKNNKKHPRKYSMEMAMRYSQMAQKCSDSILYNKKSFIRFCQDQKITDLSEENLEKIRKCLIEFK